VLGLQHGSADIYTETRASFEKETSIHVYSLEPGPIEVRGHDDARTRGRQLRTIGPKRAGSLQP
jgi:hypothetical protein